MATDVIIPPLGESISEATVGQWLKQPGEAVAADEPIVSLETDKVAVEVPSPVAGIMGAQLFKVGDTVAVGARIAIVDAAGEAASPPPAPVADKAGSEATAAAAAPTPVAAAEKKADDTAPVSAVAAQAAAPGPSVAAAAAPLDAMGPAVRTLVDTYNLDIASIAASGRDGRLTKGDVLAAIEAGTAKVKASAAAPAAAAVAAPAVSTRREERVRMTRLRQTIARRLKEAQNTAAMLTTFNDVDMTAVMAARVRYKDLFEKKHGVRLGFMSFFSQAVVLALR
ncbi:MAG: 2-oxo acid dehydrogenase subunit E2, partial [Sandarakinorhabdus sp.]|nr:2-oxo acid dehydrogenase subunit E2 [Sandarakinorhabdus sp.]